MRIRSIILFLSGISKRDEEVDYGRKRAEGICGLYVIN
jgi:hypothetical protein